MIKKVQNKLQYIIWIRRNGKKMPVSGKKCRYQVHLVP